MNRERIKILLVDHFGGISGGQRSALQFISKVDKNKFEILVACPAVRNGFADALTDLGVTVKEIHFNAPNSDPSTEGGIYRRPLKLFAALPRVIASISGLKAVVKKHQIDLVYGNSFKASALLCCIFGSAKRPLVVRLRTSRAFSNHGWIDRLICWRADLLLANSQYVADTFLPIVKKVDKLKVLYNCGGITGDYADKKEHDRRNLRAELGLGESGLVFGQVGRLTPRKRVLDVIRCLPGLESKIPEYKCIFVGGYEESEESAKIFREASRLAAEIGVADHIAFLGFRDDALHLLNGMDAMVLASQDEPMARVVIEALGLGVPIIASDHGGNAEIIRHRINGMTYPLGDSQALAELLVEILNDSSLQDFIRVNGKKTYQENFTERATLMREFILLEGLVS